MGNVRLERDTILMKRIARPILKWTAGIALALAIGIAWIAPKFSKYQSYARQSEAKIAMTAISGSERVYFDAYKKYTTDFESIGFVQSGQRVFYAYAIVTCENSQKSPPRFYNLDRIRAENSREPVKAALQIQLDRENCSRRNEGFALFAAAQISSTENSIDVWRVDETYRLGNPEPRL